MVFLRNLLLIIFLIAAFPPVGVAVLLLFLLVKATRHSEPLGLRGRRAAKAWLAEPPRSL